MLIVMITENDPAGMGIAFSNALNRYSDHECRLITTEIRYNFMFEKDLHLPFLGDEGLNEVRDLLSRADIIHFHMLFDEERDLGKIRIRDFIHGKKIVHHHHGHPEFRSGPGFFREKYRRLKRKTIVSTPDLLGLLPEAVWIPNIVPINDPLFMPVSEEEGDMLWVCQSPTRKDLKNTREFEDVMNSLTKTVPGLGCRIIENTLYTDCLRLKQGCHIHFDHMQGYFGVSSLESLSQGKPLIAGLDHWNISHIREFTGCTDLPWVIARDPDELKNNLVMLAEDPDLRRRCGELSRKFMESHWTEKHAVDLLTDLYESL